MGWKQLQQGKHKCTANGRVDALTASEAEDTLQRL